jgi:nodulation protein E
MDSAQGVAITGLGVVSAIGNSLDNFWMNVLQGMSAIAPVGENAEGLNPALLLARVNDRNFASALAGHPAAKADRFSQFAVIAARNAMTDSQLDLDSVDRERVAVILGSAMGGQLTQDAAYVQLYQAGAKRLPPLTVPKIMTNASVSHLSMDLGLRGESYAVSSACASSTHAIGQAMRLIRSGDADVAVAGGSDATLVFGAIKGWEALRVISDDGCRPFCLTRNGMVLGEGAGILVLENLAAAKKRGARIYAVLAGYGATADAIDLTSPSAEHTSRAMMRALQSAGLNPEEVDHINAHGTGTRQNDLVEGQAIERVFKTASRRIAITSTKSVLGHCLGAAGALEAVATALSLQSGLVPPTAGWQESDPDIPLDIVRNEARPVRIRSALSNSFAFGGLNASLAFRSV